MIGVIVSENLYLREVLTRILREGGVRIIRTNDLERITKELKQPDRLAILDLRCEELQAEGVLKQLVNVGSVSRSKVACICPDKDEKLKKLAKDSNAHAVFIRFNLENDFKEYIKTL